MGEGDGHSGYRRRDLCVDGLILGVAVVAFGHGPRAFYLVEDFRVCVAELGA